MPEIEMDHEDYLSMIKNPLEVGAVRIHMDPERIDTLFGALLQTPLRGKPPSSPR